MQRTGIFNNAKVGNASFNIKAHKMLYSRINPAQPYVIDLKQPIRVIALWKRFVRVAAT